MYIYHKNLPIFFFADGIMWIHLYFSNCIIIILYALGMWAEFFFFFAMCVQ